MTSFLIRYLISYTQDFLKIVALAALGLSFSTSQSALLPLPASLKGKPIYYEKVKQLDQWSCGYNALYNACKLETRFERPNGNSDLTNFTATCLPYLKKIKKNPKNSSGNKMLEELASRLNLQTFNCLTITDSIIEHLFAIPTAVTHPKHMPKAEINRLARQAQQKRCQDHMIRLKHELKKATTPYFIHFICRIVTPQGGHFVLASVVKDKQGTISFFIADNMNGSIEDNSELKRFIDYIYNYLNSTEAPPHIAVSDQITNLPTYKQQTEIRSTARAQHRAAGKNRSYYSCVRKTRLKTGLFGAGLQSKLGATTVEKIRKAYSLKAVYRNCMRFWLLRKAYTYRLNS